MRYRAIRVFLSTITLTTVDGALFNFRNGSVTQVGMPWDDYLVGMGEATQCGIRRDGTAVCSWARYPWTGK